MDSNKADKTPTEGAPLSKCQSGEIQVCLLLRETQLSSLYPLMTDSCHDFERIQEGQSASNE